MKKKVLFVCLGNICRSPAAEGIFKSFVDNAGLSDQFEIDSAGMHSYHEGEKADPRMRERAYARGYNLTSRSRPVKVEDFEYFDHIIGMDSSNVSALNRLSPAEYKHKIELMSDYCTRYKADSIPDPYYGGTSGFDHVIDLLEDACENLCLVLK